MSGRLLKPREIADIIERFLSGSGRYPQEFSDFIDCALSDPKLDAYRQRCEILHSEFEPRRSGSTVHSLDDHPQKREAGAVRELERVAAELRLLELEPGSTENTRD